jgi:hypothetical protein
MKLPSFVKDFENKWIALSKKPLEVVSSARTYKALERKLTKDQKAEVTVLKVPKFDQNIP